MGNLAKSSLKKVVGLLWLLSVLTYCSAFELVDICLIDSIYVGHQEGVLGVDKLTINEMTERPCILKIETYSNCLLSVEPHGDDFTFGRCPFGNDHSTVSCTPGCSYLFMFDAYYRNKTLKFYEGSQSNEWFHPFKTTSSSLYVGLCHTGKPLQFQLKYTTEDKWTTIESSSTDVMSRGKIMSPFFPESYMQNSEHYTYYFKRKRSGDYVYLKFDDWNISPTTEFFFENSNIAGPVSGKDNRPVVVSNSNHDLRVIFNTGRASSDTLWYMGYKATYRFVSNNLYVQRPLTHCGGYFLNSVGGVIEFQSRSINAEFYDCLWVVKTYPGFTKTYLKLIEFKSQTDFYQEEVNYFAVRRGLTSDGELIGKVYPKSIDKAALGFVDGDGFYIRLIGKFTPLDSLKLSYASYTEHTTACVGSRTFRCSIGKCISSKLKCDGVDHCGDNSDENIGCTGSDGDWQRSHQYTITVSVIIPMVIAIFLIIILCVLFVLVRRCRRNQMLEQARRDGLPSISGEMSSRQRRRRRRNGRPRDAPPSYEEVLQNTPSFSAIASTFNFPNPDGFPILHPPSYEEVVGAAGAANHQEANEMVRPQPGNISPASSSDISHTDITTSYHHRNLTPMSSDSTDSSRIRPSVHSYSMSYSSDSEMDVPRMNREVREESPVIDRQPTSQQMQNVNKVTEQDTLCCQVSIQEVRPKNVGNKSQNASQELEQNSSAETASSLENSEHVEVCQGRHSCTSDNEQRAGPSVESSRTSASTQTKKKRNKRKKSRTKRQESVNSEQEVNMGSTAAVDGREELVGHSCHSASAVEVDSENLSFDFCHFNVNTHSESGHDNLAFCGDNLEDNIGDSNETVINVTEDPPCLNDQRYSTSPAEYPGNGGHNFEMENRTGIEECSVSEQLPNDDDVSVPSNTVHHVDSLPLQSPGEQIGPSFLALLHEGNDEDIFV